MSPKHFGRAMAATAHHVSPSAGHTPLASPTQGPTGHGCLGVAGCSGSPMALPNLFCVGRASSLIAMASFDGGKCQQAHLHNQGQPPSLQSPAHLTREATPAPISAAGTPAPQSLVGTPIVAMLCSGALPIREC